MLGRKVWRAVGFGLAAVLVLGGCDDDGGGGGDTTPPSFSSISADIDPAKAGDALTITFTASETLAANPTVTVDGFAASFVSVAGLDYTYDYIVSGSEAEGPVAIGVAQNDLAGNVGLGAGSVTLDFTAPTITVDALTTADTTPQLTGTVDDTAAAISVTVDGQTNAATNDGDGTWTLADNALTALGEATYDVQASATDAAGNVGTDSTTGELTIGGTLDVNGFWNTYLQEGVNPEEAMGLTCFGQTGDSVSAVSGDLVFSGTVSGNTLVLTGDITAGPMVGGYMTLTATASGADELSGPFEMYDAGGVLVMSGTSRMVRYTPSGSFSASGTVDKGAGTRSINVSTATDGWGYIEGAGGVATDVDVWYSSPTFALKFNFLGVENITTGPLAVVSGSPGPGEVDLEIVVTDLAGAIYYGPDSGSFTISKYDATGFAGTFTLGFEGVADTLTGSFDVPWDIYKGTPF